MDVRINEKIKNSENIPEGGFMLIFRQKMDGINFYFEDLNALYYKRQGFCCALNRS
jgi:hypothetical protein